MTLTIPTNYCPKQCSSKQSGFTLIELLVVVSIIALLASVILTSVKVARARSRDVKRKEDIAQLQKALELYYSSNGQYPASGGAVSPNNSWSNSADSSWSTLQSSLSQFISTMPKDPVENNNSSEWGGSGYHYSYFSSGYGCSQQWYMFVFQLELASGQDPGQTSCDGTYFQYGGAGLNTAIKTIGGKAK